MFASATIIWDEYMLLEGDKDRKVLNALENWFSLKGIFAAPGVTKV